MATLTTRPNSTVSGGTLTVTGAATRHEATSDDSDSSYVETVDSTSSCVLGVAAPSVPGGSLVKQIRVRHRRGKSSPGGTNPEARIQLSRDDGATPISNQTEQVGDNSPATVSLPSTPLAVTPIGLRVEIGRITSGRDVLWYEMFVDTVHVPQPVVDITAPTGTVETNTPTVTWDRTLDSDGGGQTHYHVRIKDGTSAVIFDTLAVAGSDISWQVPDPLPNDNYTAEVRIAQTVGGVQHWSEWDTQAFTVGAPEVTEPTLTLTPEDDNGRIHISVEEVASPTEISWYEIQTSEDGLGWEHLRTLLGLGRVTPTGATTIAYDYEAPNGVLRHIRVRAVADVDGDLIASDWLSDSTLWEDPKSWWIKHPLLPSLNVKVPRGKIGSQTGMNRDSGAAVHKVLGAESPVVARDPSRIRPSGELILHADTAEERASLDAIYDEGGIALVQAPRTDRWRERWVAFISDHGSEGMVDKLAVEETFESLTWQEIKRPLGNLVGW